MAPSIPPPVRPVPEVRHLDLEQLSGSVAVTSGTAAAALTIALRGESDPTALNRTQSLLDTLLPVPLAVVVDLTETWCRTGRLIRMVWTFREQRHAAGRECRLQGLHPGVIPHLESLEMGTLLAAYHDARPT